MAKRGDVTVTCALCGEEFLTYRWFVTEGRGKYCTRSCASKVRATKHGHSRDGGRSPAYRSWTQMKSRCSDPANASYERYGAAGITVCDRWQDFENFLADMGDRPPRMTIDRIDGTKGYSPENCRWATRKEQQRNLRSNFIITYRGRQMCVVEAAELADLSYHMLLMRIKRGWPEEYWFIPKTSSRRKPFLAP